MDSLHCVSLACDVWRAGNAEWNASRQVDEAISTSVPRLIPSFPAAFIPSTAAFLTPTIPSAISYPSPAVPVSVLAQECGAGYLHTHISVSRLHTLTRNNEVQ